MRALLAILRIGLRSLHAGRVSHLSAGSQEGPEAGAPPALQRAGAPPAPAEGGADLSGIRRGAPGVRLALVVALSSLAGALSGLLPAVAGAALGAVAGRAARPTGGLGGAIARLLDGAPPASVVLAALGATLASASVAVLSGRKSSELAGDLTAALRVALFRAALSASPRDVDAAGRALLDAQAAGPAARSSAAPPAGSGARPAPPAGSGARPAPPAGSGARPAPPARGAEVVRLAIVRDAGLVADFALAVATGLPQAVATLAVLAAALASSGMALVLAGGAALFAASRLAADRASGRVARAMREMQHADTAVFGAAGEALAGAEDLRLLGARDQAVRELAGAACRVADARRRFGQALAVSGQIKGVFAALSPLVIVAAIAASRGGAGAGEVGELLLVVPLLMARLEALDALRAGFIERAPLLRATLALLRLPEHPPRAEGGLAAGAGEGAAGAGEGAAGAGEGAAGAGEGAAGAPPRAGAAAGLGGDTRRPLAIAFERVSFTPPGASRPVLDGVSLSIPAGAVVGICGRSGSGKSMLLRLLLRLDEPSSGAITVGGVDLRRIPPEELPRLFGVVGQSSRLFERSIRDNLALGLDPPPPEDRMREALRRVELDELAGLPGAPAVAGAPPEEAPAGLARGPARGLATEVRASPPSLSGGEARRLLLARVLLREPGVFVLDEPEAGLPGATAEAVLRTACEVAGGRTAVVVTHAPHLLRSTFNVLLDGGRVAAVGTHEALRESSALYRSLLAEALQRSAARPAP
ncbi:ATP-binding cassette domain-containing protein [Sorangium sp. So ce854]|uniref:ATP-binding cassette domain-containing protein n=1 Tax=Sorangium sp. So ce854 TaxID=3133322 RepID=UPI003F5FA139